MCSHMQRCIDIHISTSWKRDTLKSVCSCPAMSVRKAPYLNMQGPPGRCVSLRESDQEGQRLRCAFLFGGGHLTTTIMGGLAPSMNTTDSSCMEASGRWGRPLFVVSEWRRRGSQEADFTSRSTSGTTGRKLFNSVST